MWFKCSLTVYRIHYDRPTRKNIMNIKKSFKILELLFWYTFLQIVSYENPLTGCSMGYDQQSMVNIMQQKEIAQNSAVVISINGFARNLCNIFIYPLTVWALWPTIKGQYQAMKRYHSKFSNGYFGIQFSKKCTLTVYRIGYDRQPEDNIIQ